MRAERPPVSPADEAFSIITLGPERLGSAARLDDALRAVPGFSLFRRSSSAIANPTIQGASLRGIGPNGAGRALITLDGVPQNDPFGGWVYWSRFLPEAVSSATIVRGSGGGPYGAGALTGIVALEENRPAPGQFVVSASVGELGAGSGAFAGTLSAGSGGLTLFGTAGQSDGWVPVEPARRGPVDAAAFAETWAASATAWGAFGVDGAFSARVAAFEESRGAGTVLADSTARGTDVSVAFSGRREDRSWRLQVYVQDRDLANRTAGISNNRTVATPALEQVATPATGFGASAALRLNGPVLWDLGADVRVARGETQERFRFMGGQFTRNRRAGGEQVIAGAFATATVDRGPWLATLTGRVDHWRRTGAFRIESDAQTGASTLDDRASSADGTEWTGRIGLRRELGEQLSLRGAAYAGFRAPSLNELHRPFRIGNDVTEANPLLKPERLVGAEIGLDSSSGPLAVAGTLFWNVVQDPIANVTLGTGPGTFPLAGFIPAGGAYRQRQNVGSIDALGLEVDGALTLSEHLTLRAAYAWVDAEVDGGSVLPNLSGKRPPQAPEHTGTLSLQWRPTAVWSIDATVRAESARFEDDQNLRPLKGGSSLDARVGRSFGPVELFVAGDNLLDSDLPTAVTFDGIRSLASPRVIRAGFVWRGG